MSVAMSMAMAAQDAMAKSPTGIEGWQSLGLMDRTEEFVKATGIPESLIRETVSRVAEVGGMAEGVDLLVNAMTLIEAKGVTGIEAAFEFAKAATLIAKTAEKINSLLMSLDGSDAASDLVEADEAVNPVAKVTGMTEGEVREIYGRIARLGNRSKGSDAGRGGAETKAAMREEKDATSLAAEAEDLSRYGL